MDDGLLSLKWNNHKTTFFYILSELRKKQSYTDATLACEGKFFPVHKLVMSTCSDYFSEIFEQTTCKSPVVILKDIKHKDLESLLDYMYIGEVDVKQTDLAGLIKAAECLRIKGLAVPDENPNTYNVPKKSHIPERRSSPHPKRPRRDNHATYSESNLGQSHSSGSPFTSKPVSSHSLSDETLSHVPSQTLDPLSNTVHNQPSPILVPIETIKLEIEDDEELTVSIQSQSSIPLNHSEESGGLVQDEVGEPVKQEHDDPTNDFSHSGEFEKEEHDQDDPYDGDDQLPGPSGVQEDQSLLLPWGEDEGSFPNLFEGEDASHQQVLAQGYTSTQQELANSLSSTSQPRIRKSYRCLYCRKVFKRSNHLQLHTLAHTGEKPYWCPHCHYKARQECHLDRHIIGQHKSACISCSHCDFLAINQLRLARHLKKKHFLGYS